MTERAAVILAAGQGTRMKSPLPKVLHRVAGRALVDCAIDAAEGLGCSRIVVVVGAHSPEVGRHVEKRLGEGSTAVQDPPLGTGHAVQAAAFALEGFEGDVIITTGDAPLLTAEAIAPLLDVRRDGADLAVLAFEAADPTGYGRMIMAGERLERIVEHKDASEAERAVTACNAGIYCAPAALLFDLLSAVGNNNAKGEYYLTDIVAIAEGRGLNLGVAFAREDQVLGVNSQVELAAAEALFQASRRRDLMEAGVSMAAPDTVHLAWDTVVEGGAVIEPYVVFGPGTVVEAGAQIRAFSHIEGAVVHPGAIIGPYARLRPGADIGQDAHVGNFVEVKNVKLGQGAKANHLSYLGDGSVGARTNIGAGTIFCNYDGYAKANTTIGEGAFIGSNTALVAPVTVGDGAMTGTGSVITKDVSAGALALARAQQIEKPGWADLFRRMKQKAKS